MSTRFDTSDETDREGGLAAAALAIRRGDLVVVPTDTVYGVGCDAFDADAVTRLLEAKGRGRDMPPPVLVSAVTTLDALTTGVPDWARVLIDVFWPGPLTIVCTPAALAAVGPRRHARHGRGADAPARHRPGAAPAHRPAGGELGEHHRAARRDQCRRGDRDARRPWSRSCSTRARRRASSRPRSSTAPATGRASCARARSRRVRSTVCSRTRVTPSTTAKMPTVELDARRRSREPPDADADATTRRATDKPLA